MCYHSMSFDYFEYTDKMPGRRWLRTAQENAKGDEHCLSQSFLEAQTGGLAPN